MFQNITLAPSVFYSYLSFKIAYTAFQFEFQDCINIKIFNLKHLMVWYLVKQLSRSVVIKPSLLDYDIVSNSRFLN